MRAIGLLVLLVFFCLAWWQRQYLFSSAVSLATQGSVPAKVGASAAPILSLSGSPLDVQKAISFPGAAVRFDEALCDELANQPLSQFELIYGLRLQAAVNDAKQSLEKILEKARVSKEASERAAALVLSATQLTEVANQALTAQMADLPDAQRAMAQQKNDACDAGTGICDDHPPSADRRTAATYVNEVAKLATEARDGTLYGLALMSCASISSALQTDCQQISARQWAQRDPDNAVAWLSVMDELGEPANTALLDEAMYRFAKASGFDSGLNPVASFVQRQLDLASLPNENKPGAGASWVGHTVGSLAGSINAYSHGPNYLPIMTRCTVDQLGDANRRQLCDQVAHRLVEQGDSLRPMILGVKLAERLAWSPAVLAPIREDVEALRWTQNSTLSIMNAPEGSSDGDKGRTVCRAMLQFNRSSLRRLAQGELVDLRASMAHRGLVRAGAAALWRAGEARQRAKSANPELAQPEAVPLSDARLAPSAKH